MNMMVVRAKVNDVVKKENALENIVKVKVKVKVKSSTIHKIVLFLLYTFEDRKKHMYMSKCI